MTEILALADGRISEDALFDWIPLHSPDVNLCVEALDQFARECRTLF